MAKNKTKDYKKMNTRRFKERTFWQIESHCLRSNFKHKMGQLKESHLLKETRKNIARIKTEMEKMAAKTLQGVVTSQKMNKTITVVVGRRKNIQNMGNI